jgi:urea carboxylase
MPVTKLLIANRGEISCRAQRACADLGLPCVAVFTAPDALSLHVLRAAESVCLGPAPKEYLNADRLLEVAAETGEQQNRRPQQHQHQQHQHQHQQQQQRPASCPLPPAAGRRPSAARPPPAPRAGCDAVFPGYGFLSENADFAERCEKAGVAFIGPTADTMRQFSQKHTARALAEDAGVPVLPGTSLLSSGEEALEAARTIGLPILLKATGAPPARPPAR